MPPVPSWRAPIQRAHPGFGQVESLDKFTEEGTLNYGPALFIFSFIVIVVWVLLQATASASAKCRFSDCPPCSPPPGPFPARPGLIRPAVLV